MSDSAICPKFAQNAWRKDLCSNCFKSKEEHKQHQQSKASNRNAQQIQKTEMPKISPAPAKGIMKGIINKSKKFKVSFPKDLHKVIGYGGEWSTDETSDDDENFNNNQSNSTSSSLPAINDEIISSSTDDDDNQELKRLTKSNTDFNTNNGNLLGDPEENIKKSFAALRLGAPQVDSDGKKQTLKINVTPFGTPTKLSNMKGKFELKKDTKKPDQKNSIVVNKKEPMATKITTQVTTTINGDGKSSPPIERAMEKSLLEEISETLELKQKEATSMDKNATNGTIVTEVVQNGKENRIKFEINSLNETINSTMINKIANDLKKPIARNTPITKDHVKPKINVFSKYSDSSDSNTSDTENGISAYYDVVETTETTNLNENTTPSIVKALSKDETDGIQQSKRDDSNKSVYSTSQYITDMLLSSRTKSASYSLHEGSFMTSKITSDGLIVTKCASDDALDSTGSSFDGSSDEETSYNMNRSESDSGIGISITNDYKLSTQSSNEENKNDKKLSASTNNSDYEDIQVQDEILTSNKNVKLFTPEKSRESAGEPDGSADPDGDNTVEAPSLPKSMPPQEISLNENNPSANISPSIIATAATHDPRTSFLHGIQKNIATIKKPELPVKPSTVNVMKTFAKRQPTQAEQQLVNQLQQVIKSSPNQDQEKFNQAKKDATAYNSDYSKFLKKGRAPNPPPSPSTENVNSEDSESSTPQSEQKDFYDFDTKITSHDIKKIVSVFNSGDTNSSLKQQQQNIKTQINNLQQQSQQQDENHSSIYTRNPTAIGMVGKSTSPVIREKDKRERAIINPKFRSLNTFSHRKQQQQQQQLLSNKVVSIKPEPAPRKNLSMSEECLVDAEKKKKTKFSIKKFLRMGTSKTTDNLHKKDGIYSEIVTGDDGNTSGKPRLVIIHPIDINTTGVEVIKDISSKNNANDITGNDSSNDGDISPIIVTGKPPAPPQRNSNVDGQRINEMNKPARPPPPKSAELRRKQKISFNVNATGSVKSKSDNVYANLGEIRSAIAPRKPERTASMREREAQLELARKRLGVNDNYDTISVCSSNGGSVSNDLDNSINHLISEFPFSQNSPKKNLAPQAPSPSISSTQKTAIVVNNSLIISESSATATTTTFTKPIITDLSPKEEKLNSFERKQNKIDNVDMNNSNCISVGIAGGKSIASKLELFEKGLMASETTTKVKLMNDGLKDSVRKISSTIDSYLKDKRDYECLYDIAKTIPPPTPIRNASNANVTTGNDVGDIRRSYEMMANTAAGVTTTSMAITSVPQSTTSARNQSTRSILQENQSILCGNVAAGVCHTTRSEYGGVGNRPYGGFNNSLANIPRVVSASYCGSEIGESDIYSPYSFYGGSETGGDVANDIHDSVWGVMATTKSRVKTINRLRMRKGRSVVHKNIEDNYSAVIVANHEALAQVLDQLQQSPVIPPALRPLANALNLRFDDFNILEGGQPFVVGKRAFHAAIWNSAPVTLALSADCNQMSGELNQLSGGISGVLNPITEFCDLVPNYNLPLMPSTEIRMLQATVSVLPRMQLDTLHSIGAILKNKSQILDKHISNFRGSMSNLSGLVSGGIGQSNDMKLSNLRNVCSVQNLSTLNEEIEKTVTATSASGNGNTKDDVLTIPGMPSFDDVMCREVSFIMLQLVNGLKNLQAKAIEEMPLSLSNVILSKEVDNKDAQARLCVLHGNNADEEEPVGPLCKCAHIALYDLLPTTKMTPILSNILIQERSESLSKAKAVLEFALWGPSDVALTGTTKERELALQRWLDLERATVLHGLVRSRVELTVYDECHLMFLVRSSAKIMNEAAKILSNSKTLNSDE